MSKREVKAENRYQMRRYRARPVPGMTACICGNTNITWYPASAIYRKWYCPKCGIVCRLFRNLKLELKAIRERNKLLRKRVVLPPSFKPWKLYGNGVRMSGYSTEAKANNALSRQVNQQPGGKFWVQYEITAEDAGLLEDPDPQPFQTYRQE